MMDFSFSAPRIIRYGPGTAIELSQHIDGRGGRAFAVTGSSPDRYSELLDDAAFVGSATISGEPTIAVVADLADQARAAGATVVVGVGGGSVLDAAKATAAIAANDGPVQRYLEVIGDGEALEAPALPTVLMPTTSGTGSEMTHNAVLTSTAHRQKVSIRHPSMRADVALVDPLLTVSCPPSTTAATALDALTQCIEPYVSLRANPLTDAIALRAIEQGSRSIRRAVTHGADVVARCDVSLMSMSGGLCLANAKLGAVHGFAGPIGGAHEIAHGKVCGALLAASFAVNARAVADRGDPAILERFETVAHVLTGDATASIEDGASWLESLVRDVGIDGLGSGGVQPTDFADLISRAATSSSMAGNPIRLTNAELEEILELSL